jgi:hypothetical protein
MKASRKVKSAHKASGRGLTLKEFARSLKDAELVSAWYDNKAESAQRREKAARKERKSKVLNEMRAARRAAQEKNKKK